MCGIIGYVGEQSALGFLSTGLSNLEYRGYDSAGVALVDEDIDVYKQAGEVSELQAVLPENTSERIGIGHTRWSTHGPPTRANAHPHTDGAGQVAVVHNGIIENYETLREELSERTFTSDTDTEVIPHLVARELDSGASPLEAVEEAIGRLEGSFAVVIAIAGHDKLFAVRRDSPLVLGHADHGTFLGSDVTAFLEETQEVTYLDDGELAVIDFDGVELFADGERVDVERQTLDWEADAAEKGGYEHYMLKEIHEQPRALRQTLSGRLNTEDGTVELDIDLPTEYLNSLEEVQFVACGTSYYAGQYAATLVESLAEVRTSVHIASEYEFSGGRDPWRTLVIAVTQSGETADTLSAIRKATRAGARTLAVTNTLGSTITRVVDDSVFIRAGPEIGVAATKTFASQVATLAMVAVSVGRSRGVLSSERAVEILESLRALPGAVQQVLDADKTVAEIAHEYADSEAFFYIGRQLGYPVALEGALKLKEISYDHAEGFAAGELKHGPLALVTEETPVLAVLTDGTRPSETMNNIKEVQARGADVVGVVSSDVPTKQVDMAFSVPECGVVEPLVANVYWQLFAYYVAHKKDRSIDRPRNLAKSVTVE